MWIRDVELPEALIEAHRAGKLVIFVGAGASKDTPSDLPDFRTLTTDIAADAHIAVTDLDLDHPDVLLGRIADGHVDVHRRVAARIGVTSSKPNRLHAAVIELAKAGPPPRIVTTNYDRHLSAAAGTRGISIAEYHAPALPIGGDFSGLVYLHGSLAQESRHLVVTDRDFGGAYLRDAWAARFLERMFATFTVLFVGYSHGDIVMRYLARALGPDSSRYVLTPTPDASDWRALGIHPVGYQVVGDSHLALVEAIEGWASLASMGLLDHRQRVAQLVSAAPSQVPEEASYLKTVIADSDTVRLFAEFARGADWLAWAATQAEFRRMFDPTAPPTDCTGTLAYWFAEHFVMDESLSATALTVVRDAGGRLGPAVWSAIGHHLHVKGAPRPEWLRRWLVVLIQNNPGNGQPWLEYALMASRWPEDNADALLLFDALTDPLAVFRPSYGLDGPPRFDVEVRGDDHWLREAWRDKFVPNLADAAPAVLASADRHLRQTHLMLLAAGAANSIWDPVSFGRSAVDPHPQDRVPGSVDVIIDAARDALQLLLDAGHPLGIAILQTWEAAEVPMLRRLAAHGWVYRTDVDATTKLSHLRAQGWLFDHELRHEVFRLIAATLRSADNAVADALVADAVAGPADVGDTHRAYEQFNALAWMAGHAPGLQSAQDALERVQAKHPEFVVRPYPDLVSWSESGAVGPRPPMTPAQLHERIAADAADAVAELRSYEHAAAPFDGPTWYDTIGVLVEAVRDNPTDGFAVLDAVGGDVPDIVRGVIRGWAATTVDTPTANRILDRLTRVDLAAAADDLARLLSDGGQGDATPTEWHRLPASRHLASDLWMVLEATTTASGDGGLGRAINHPAGRLGLFWVNAIAGDWRDAGESWAGIAPETRVHLEILLAGDDERTVMVEVIFASQLHFFFAADRAWGQTHVLPLLDWGNPTRAPQTWDGFLAWGRWNDQLLAAGLLADYLGTARHLGELRDEGRRQLCAHLANVAVSSEIDPIDWMRTFTVTVDVADRVEWMKQVTSILSRLPADAVEHQWTRWMRQYWRDRLDSIPVDLTDEEASAMAAWVVHLTESIGDGVALATGHPAGVGNHADILHDLSGDRLDRAPAAFATLLAHLLAGTQAPFWGGHYLDQIVPRIRPAAAEADMRAIAEQSMRLGHNGVAHW